MTLVLYGILIVLALFIVLMVFNPNLSCFGRKLKSPLYPVLRKKKLKKKQRETTDYGFDLGGPGEKRTEGARSRKQTLGRSPGRKQPVATEDYGFDLGGSRSKKNRAE